MTWLGVTWQMPAERTTVAISIKRLKSGKVIGVLFHISISKYVRFLRQISLRKFWRRKTFCSRVSVWYLSVSKPTWCYLPFIRMKKLFYVNSINLNTKWNVRLCCLLPLFGIQRKETLISSVEIHFFCFFLLKIKYWLKWTHL